MAAAAAASRGPVLLVESMQLPREKSCGGMLNEYAQAFIANTLHTSLPEELLVGPDTVHFCFHDFDRSLRKPTKLAFRNVERARFDEWLLGFLPENVDVAGNTRLVGLDAHRSGVEVTLRQTDEPHGERVTLSCDYVVGADGPMSTTRSLLPVSQLAHYKTLQDFVPLTGDIEPYFNCIYARNIGGGYGYGYVVPKGDVALIGSVFYPKSRNVRQLHEQALELYRSFYAYGAQTLKREAWSAISVTSVEHIVGGYGRVLLAGEAGGIFSPTSGEGISFALNSGTYAGEAIAAAREDATTVGKRAAGTHEESDALRRYRAALGPIRKTIGRRLRIFPIIDSDWGKWLGGIMPDAIVDRTAHMI